MTKQQYPILEFDPVSLPVVCAKKYLPHFISENMTDKCLITYFSDVVDQFEREYKVNQVFKIRTEGIRPSVYFMQAGPFKKPVFVIPMPIGAPQAARVVEAMCAVGVKKFMVCGGAGTLDDTITGKKTLIPTSAIRDEGTSYHYLPPAREVQINPIAEKAIEKVLNREGVEYEKVKTWTTDAIFRETADKVALRKSEGCSVVEMECSAFYAVAQYKKVVLGQILYAGDIVSVDEWDYRDWHTRYECREKLFELGIKCLLEL